MKIIKNLKAFLPSEGKQTDPLSAIDSGDENVSHDSRSLSASWRSSSYDKNSINDSTSNTFHTNDSDEEQTVNSITRKETRQVYWLRVAVILILIAAATSVSITVYYINRTAETEEFEIQYYGIADKIIASLEEIMVEIAAVSGLAVETTLYSQAPASEGFLAEWPFRTLANFQERAGNAREISGAMHVSINPIIPLNLVGEWENYVRGNACNWIDEGLAFQEAEGLNDFISEERIERSWLTTENVDPLHTFSNAGEPILSQFGDSYFMPRWQTSPVLKLSLVNENLLEDVSIRSIALEAVETKSAVLGGFLTVPAGSTEDENIQTSTFAALLSMREGIQVDYQGDPMSHLIVPIFDTLDESRKRVVGVLKSTIHWQHYLRGILPISVNGIMVVVKNACDGVFTYLMDGGEARVMGFGDQHDSSYDKYGVKGRFQRDVIEDGTLNRVRLNQDGCPYTFHVYPTQQYVNEIVTLDPIIVSVSVAIVFVFAIAMFLFYDRLVEHRQKLVLGRATQTTAIISTLFVSHHILNPGLCMEIFSPSLKPKKIRDRLLEAPEDNKRKSEALRGANYRLRSYLTGTKTEDDQAIADFFPNCTVFFGNIVGFSAWSSTREPSQVFVLLQTVYQSFDGIAKRRRVFKVETIGDTYLAVAGLPEPQPNHAVIMAKFAWECNFRLARITKELEVTLGPDTGDLTMRFGLHSGEVTAGVLKGDRARFQLFGDTVNTASRMESTGIPGKIQVSPKTAELLISAGKENWLIPRDDQIQAKGLGAMSTYWLNVQHRIRRLSSTGSTGSGMSEPIETTPEIDGCPKSQRSLKKARLIGWATDLLLQLIKKVVIVHERCKADSEIDPEMFYEAPDGRICLDEVKDCISMPDFDAKVVDATLDSSKVQVPAHIESAFHEYIGLIAESYRSNPFHNFEHACHVTMSVSKLLSRIVAPDLESHDDALPDNVAAQIHDYTHGITSDPLAVFAITFSALIHDADHQGVSNMQLIKEEPSLGEFYRGKSIAEQNSVDVAWDLFMAEKFKELRQYIFRTKSELMRFRQLIVNVVLATDIFDKELGDLRKSRWDRAFHKQDELSEEVFSDLRATIVMEHIIQASDVSHTMQHWHVYQKWNKALFCEMYKAFKEGRMAADPTKFWYKGELGFFDNYIIPLAKKLRECNVFGVSSDEYLGYAMKNRDEWEQRGEYIVEDLVHELQSSPRTSARAMLPPGGESIG